MITLQNPAATLHIESKQYSEEALKVYQYLNKETFENFTTISLFKPVLSLVCQCHEQFPTITYKQALKPTFCAKNNKVLICCSGGLDSVYQSLFLRAQGYEVILMHLIGANFYSNGQEYKVFAEFAKKYGFTTYEPKISPAHKGEYKKYWSENSFKNFLIYSIAIDYMLEHNIYYLSSGDDLGLDISNQVTGVNTGDAKQLTDSFMWNFGVNFIPVDKKVDKAQRLAFLDKYGARDYYLSCVGPGRLIQSQRKRYETKFKVKVDKWCCCTCRKCCFHILLDYYYNNKHFPQELIDRCWEKLGNKNSADYIFFNSSIPLAERIKKLKTY